MDIKVENLEEDATNEKLKRTRYFRRREQNLYHSVFKLATNQFDRIDHGIKFHDKCLPKSWYSIISILPQYGFIIVSFPYNTISRRQCTRPKHSIIALSPSTSIQLIGTYQFFASHPILVHPVLFMSANSHAL